VPGSIVGEFASRGLIHDSTDRTELDARCGRGPLSAYVGFDPTADSLHVGHLLGQVALRRLQLLGHRPIVLAGGATGMIGDPSGRSEERNLLDADALESNVASISAQLERLLDFSPGPSGALLVNNAHWTAGSDLIAFLRDVGKHVTVNQMLAKDSVRSRLDGGPGLSYTEFSYMLLQANDFRHLCEHHGCELQLGGSDQWGNITVGIDLVRKVLGRAVHGLTWPLVTKTDGTKFGKTASGAVWLSAERTSVYQFHQFWMGLADDDVASLLPWFSLASVADVATCLEAHRTDPGARIAQRSLAREMTSLVHGGRAAESAEEAAAVLFGGDPYAVGSEIFEMLAKEIPTVRAEGATDPLALLVSSGIVASNSEARRLISQRGLRVNGEVLEDGAALHSTTRIHDRWVLLRKGKSTYALIDLR
jgi:tyrosyl-tRNA synthetase